MFIAQAILQVARLAFQQLNPRTHFLVAVGKALSAFVFAAAELLQLRVDVVQTRANPAANLIQVCSGFNAATEVLELSGQLLVESLAALDRLTVFLFLAQQIFGQVIQTQRDLCQQVLDLLLLGLNRHDAAGDQIGNV